MCRGKWQAQERANFDQPTQVTLELVLRFQHVKLDPTVRANLDLAAKVARAAGRAAGAHAYFDYLRPPSRHPSCTDAEPLIAARTPLVCLTFTATRGGQAIRWSLLLIHA